MSSRTKAAAVTSMDTSGYMDFSDIPATWRWMKETARTDPEGFLWLSLGQAEAFGRLHGPARWVFDKKTGHEWTHGWIVFDGGRTFLILTGAHSSRYLVQGDAPDDMEVAQACIGFLGELLRRLTGEQA